MLTQKLYKNGNSVAITIPKEYLSELGLDAGAEVVMKKRGQELVVTSPERALTKNIDQKFAKMVEEFIDDHEDVLRDLASK